jgi:hypothetical protein
MDRFELFAQKILALRPIHCVLGFGADFSAKFENFDLAGKLLGDLLDPHLQIKSLQDFFLPAKDHELPERLGELIQGKRNTFSGLMSGGDNESQKVAPSLDLLQRHMGEIRRYPVLDRDEECRPFREGVAFDSTSGMRHP